jgi:large subunit ribosomal protein L35
MYKIKTKSSAKKRFRITATGKVKMPQAGKRHGMIKRTNSQIRRQRGMAIMSKPDAKIVKSYMPNSLRSHFCISNYVAQHSQKDPTQNSLTKFLK